MMKILLDFDGVVITTPSWQKVPLLDDGFMAFNKNCASNVAKLVDVFSAHIVLTTTHRIHHSNEEWQGFLANRSINTTQVSKSNNARTHAELDVRCKEIMQWVEKNPHEAFIILDDDKSLCELPENIKKYWIQTDFMLGLTDELTAEAMKIMALG